jgi:hypothetical protein
MTIDFANLGRVSQRLPQPVRTGLNTDIRLSIYGDQIVKLLGTGKHTLADEGSYFCTTNPTIGTALAYGVITAFSDTAALFILANSSNDSDQGLVRVYPDYLRIIPTVAPASATSGQFAIKLDSAIRAPTANNVALTIANPNMDISQQSASAARAWAASGGTATVPAASAVARTVSRGVIRSVIPAIGDELVIAFGQADIAGGVSGANARVVCQAPPCVLGPQDTMVVYVWFPANATTALSFEMEAGWWER